MMKAYPMPERVDRFNISDVFISYSRRDEKFVKRLDASFKSKQMQIWVDYEDIAPSVDWWEEIKAGIEGSGSFIFIISPDSIASEVCRQEINAALENGKRFIPLLHRDINMHETNENLHPAVSSHNWLYFRETDDYEVSFEKLVETINTDFDYLRQHTRLLVLAREWEARGWDSSALLIGAELDEAAQWLAKAGNAKPAPTELHNRYINTSQSHRSRQRWLWGLGTAVLIIFAALAIGLYFALGESNRNAIAAEEARLVAESAAAESNALADAASLVSSAQIAFEFGDSFSALPYAMAANRLRPLPIAQMTLADIAYQAGPIQWMNSHLSYIEQIDTSTVLAVSASRDDTLVVWDLATGLPLRTLTGHSADVKTVAFNPDGSRIASGGLDGRLIVWNSDGTGRREIRNNESPIIRLAYAPDGAHIATLTRLELDNVRSYQLGIVNIASGDFEKRFPAQETAVTSLSYSPDGSALLVGYVNGRIEAWSSLPFVSESNATEVPLRVFQQHSNGINVLEFSPDGLSFLSASVDGTIGIWHYESGQLIRRLVEHTDSVTGGAWLSNSSIFSASNDRNMIIWDLSNGSPVQIMTGHGSLPTALGVTPDFRRAISGDSFGNIILWDVAADTLTHRMATTDTPIRVVAHHPTLNQAVAATSTGDLIFWDLETRQPISTIVEVHDSAMSNVAYTPDGNFLVTAGGDCVLRIWDTKTFAFVRVLGAGCNQESNVQGHDKAVSDFAIDSAGVQVLSGSDDGAIILWDLTTGTIIRRYDAINNGKRILTVAFGKDGTTAFASSDTLLFQFELETGTITRRFVGHAESIVSIDVSPEGKHIAASDVKRAIIIWDISTGEKSQSLIGHRAPVWSVGYDSTGSRLVSSSDDGSVYIWDLQSGSILRRYEGFNAFIRSAVFSPDGSSVIFGERALSQVDLMPLDELMRWVDRNRIYRPLSCAELGAYAPLLDEPLCIARTFPLHEGENRGEIYLDSEQSWEFEAEAGEIVSVIVRADYTPSGFLPELPLIRQRRLDTILSLFAPDGRLLNVNDDNRASAFFTNSALVNELLPDDGLYHVEIGSYGGLTRGGYTLIFQRGEQ
jgi:WD40 repeat protein